MFGRNTHITGGGGGGGEITGQNNKKGPMTEKN